MTHRDGLPRFSAVPPIIIPWHVGSLFPFPRQEVARRRWGPIGERRRRPEGAGKATLSGGARWHSVAPDRRRAPLVMPRHHGAPRSSPAPSERRPTYHGIMIGGTRSVRRSDAGHRKPLSYPSHCLGKPPLRSPPRPVGGRRKTLPMGPHRLRPSSYPTGHGGDPTSNPCGSLSPLLGITRRSRDAVGCYAAPRRATPGTPAPMSFLTID